AAAKRGAWPLRVHRAPPSLVSRKAFVSRVSAYHLPGQIAGTNTAAVSYSDIEQSARMSASSLNTHSYCTNVGRIYQYDAFDIACETARHFQSGRYLLP